VEIAASTDDSNEATIASYVPMWAGIPVHMDAHSDYTAALEEARTDHSEAQIRIVDYFQYALDDIKDDRLGKRGSRARKLLNSKKLRSRGSRNKKNMKQVTDSATVAANLLKSLEDSGLIQVGGVLTTTLQTGMSASSIVCSLVVTLNSSLFHCLAGQQWDAPNAWPPLVWFTIEGLAMLDTDAAEHLSVSVF
jgi:hypothetical protein